MAGAIKANQSLFDGDAQGSEMTSVDLHADDGWVGFIAVVEFLTVP